MTLPNFFGKDVALDLTLSGHYCIPIDRAEQIPVEEVFSIKLEGTEREDRYKILDFKDTARKLVAHANLYRCITRKNTQCKCIENSHITANKYVQSYQSLP